MIQKKYKIPGKTQALIPVVKTKKAYETSNYVLNFSVPGVQNPQDLILAPYKWSDKFNGHWIYLKTAEDSAITTYAPFALEEFGSEVVISLFDWNTPPYSVDEVVEEVLLEISDGKETKVLFPHAERKATA